MTLTTYSVRASLLEVGNDLDSVLDLGDVWCMQSNMPNLVGIYGDGERTGRRYLYAYET